MPSPTTPMPELRDGLADIGLRGMADVVDDFLARVTKQRLSPVQILEEVIRLEKLDQARRSLERRMQRSRIGAFKPMADYNWNWPSKLDRNAVERAMASRFADEGANIIIVGAHGLGKTMLVKNIGHQAVLAGYTVLFLTAAKLLNDLSSQDSPRALERRIKHYARVAILCIDELGYLSYDNRAADLLFEVISRRYAAKKPIVLSTNLAFADWTQVFPHATCTIALIDRLTHRADIIQVEGKSWRTKEAKERLDKQK